MATTSAIAKRTERRQIDILEAVKGLVAEVAELKAETGRTDAIELKAEFDEAVDRTDEILAAIRSAADEIVKTEIYGLKQQVAEVSGQIADLKIILTTPATVPATARRTKK